MKFFYVFFVAILISICGDSQVWKKYPASIMIGNGTNAFMGDLGGGKKDAAHFLGIRDFDYQVVKPTWQIAYRYRFAEKFNVRVNYSYALISGTDAASGSLGRKSRNLSFRSGIYEFSSQIEYYFIKEKGVSKAAFGSLKAFTPFSAYLFVGAGTLFFNPKAKDPATGKWIALQPLGTEGQFAQNKDGSQFTYTSFYPPYEKLQTPKPYSRIAAVFSLGIGIKYDINKVWSVGLEFSNRYTTSDYIDDCHDRYFNYKDFQKQGIKAPNDYTYVFSDRHYLIDYSTNSLTNIHEDYHSGKAGRGDPNFNDAYIFGLITLYYTLRNNDEQQK